MPWNEAAETALGDARLALYRARNVIDHSRQARADRGPLESGAELPRASTFVSCGGCGRSFVVDYVFCVQGSLMSFLVACPRKDCDSMNEVSCPADSMKLSAVVLDE